MLKFVEKKMIPFLLLIAVTIFSIAYSKLVRGTYSFSLSARIGISAMLLFTALGHFLYTEGMAMMIPEIIPFKIGIVYLTALIEISATIGLHAPRFRKTTAWLLILFLILIVPANVRASVEQIDYQNANFEGNGLRYLWFRIPLQILFIVWVYFSSLRINSKNITK